MKAVTGLKSHKSAITQMEKFEDIIGPTDLSHVLGIDHRNDAVNTEVVLQAVRVHVRVRL